MQNALTLQWPTLGAAEIFAPVPQLSYREKNSPLLTATSYLTLTVAVVGYWFLIGWWIDARFLRGPTPPWSESY